MVNLTETYFFLKDRQFALYITCRLLLKASTSDKESCPISRKYKLFSLYILFSLLSLATDFHKFRLLHTMFCPFLFCLMLREVMKDRVRSAPEPKSCPFPLIPHKFRWFEHVARWEVSEQRTGTSRLQMSLDVTAVSSKAPVALASSGDHGCFPLLSVCSPCAKRRPSRDMVGFLRQGMIRSTDWALWGCSAVLFCKHFMLYNLQCW